MPSSLLAADVKKAVVSLAQRLAGGGEFAIATCRPLNSPGLSGFASGNTSEDPPTLEIPLDDTRRLEVLLEDPIIARAQLVLLLPPFGRIRDANRPNHDMSEIAARNVASALAPDKRFGTLLLPRSISGRRRSSLIDAIVGGRYVSAVIELPARELYEDVPPTMPVCVVVLDMVEPPRTVVMSLPPGTSLEMVIGEHETLTSKGGRTAHGFALEEPIDSTLGFLPNQLDPEIARMIEEASIIGDRQPLDNLCEIVSGLRPTITPREEPDVGDVPVLSVRMILDGDITSDKVNQWIEPSAGPMLQRGDIVIPATMPRGSAIRAAEVHDAELPMIAGRNVLVLRTGSELRSAERLLLRHFISSRRFSEQLVSDAAFFMHIATRELANVLVPVPNAEFLNDFQTVASATEELGRQRDAAAALMKSSLDSKDLVEARRRLMEGSNRLRQRAAETRSHLAELVANAAETAPLGSKREFDVFISHSTEDKEAVVRPLAHALRKRGLIVWYDEFQLRIGDSIREKIDAGIAQSRFGLVVLSKSFFDKGWTRYELNGLVTRATAEKQILLPIWHGISKDEVVSNSSSLGDRFALPTSHYSIKQIADEIAAVIKDSAPLDLSR